ncbi:class I SAM-dependent DNA methyltransferase [Rhodohalobacter barkolensis]|uniref:Class I SAM-dependent methyltransferase n=1 Tax=Rhodohalobacter barkolensis TaxID=2053187 RepID=A0A2N0VJM1_9BACT|nr:class I SAM-dependent methyltransferase [Rhodohalobacter barkolensis]PKD44386.1 class I SAM-dependent methyltransferase [Rhodohalobacter barkolensis]
MSNQVSTQKNYSALAQIYDDVMVEVDYETWTDYIDEIIYQYHPDAQSVLELACGTGTMALSLEELAAYEITATDGSPEMIDVAKQKAKSSYSDVQFLTRDFLNLQLDQNFDVVFMVFDSLNYLHSEENILKLHSEVRNVLNPGGLFIYDFTTPRNSRIAIKYLNNESRRINNLYRYRRKSTYNAKNREHTNRFEIEKLNSESGQVIERFQEEHCQHIYTLEEIESIIKKTEFSILNAFDGFALKQAHEKSLRITMVLQ